MRKNILKTLGLATIMIVTLGFAGCSEEASASSNDYTAYLFFNGQYIKYDNVQDFDTKEDGRVDLKMTDGKKIELYSPGNVTVVTKGAIPEPKEEK